MSRNGGSSSVGTRDAVLIRTFLPKAILASLLSVLLAMVLEYPFSLILDPFENFYGTVLMVAVVAPVVEETVKALSTVYVVKRINADAGFFVGLLFGIRETFGYLAAYANTRMQATVLFTLRLSVSIPLHAATTSMYLYGLHLYKRKRGDRYTWVIAAYLFHALFNFSSVVARSFSG